MSKVASDVQRREFDQVTGVNLCSTVQKNLGNLKKKTK